TRAHARATAERCGRVVARRGDEQRLAAARTPGRPVAFRCIAQAENAGGLRSHPLRQSGGTGGPSRGHPGLRRGADAMKDPRIAKLMSALRRRFPGTTLITGPMLDEPGSGETLIKVLNAPDRPLFVVNEFAYTVIQDLWGDEPWPALVDSVNRSDTAK